MKSANLKLNSFSCSVLLTALYTIFIFYVCLASLYTAVVLLSPAIRYSIGSLPFAHTFFDHKADNILNGTFDGFSARVNTFLGLPQSISHSIEASHAFLKHKDDLIQWNEPESIRVLRTSKTDTTSLPASLILSKAFSVSQEHLAYMGANKLDIVPYYYRANKQPKKDDVTITTLVTRDRFLVFKELVERYRGPLSVTIHVSRAELNETSEVNFLDALHALYTSSPLMSRFVDVHLVLTPSRSDRQFNAWRNIARLFARTRYALMLDVDFVPCTDLRARVKAILSTRGPLRDRLRAGSAALVVPAFEYTNSSEGYNATTFPKDKAELIHQYNQSRVAMFHASWAPGHNSTDYDRMLFKTQPGEVYRIARGNYQPAYEPYVIFRKDHPAVPWCDERFVGYGGNKAACLYEMYLAGMSFYVLSDDFLVHRAHAYDERARRRERRANRRIYADFREEACLRYLVAFRDAGVIGEERALNVIEECKKIKGIAKTAAKVSRVWVCVFRK